MFRQFCVQQSNGLLMLCPTVRWLVCWVSNSLMVRLCFFQLSNGQTVDLCKAAKFNSIDYFQTQDFGINIQSSIFQDKNLTFLNDRVFSTPQFWILKQSSIFQCKFLNIQLDNAKNHEYIKLLLWTGVNWWPSGQG